MNIIKYTPSDPSFVNSDLRQEAEDCGLIANWGFHSGHYNTLVRVHGKLYRYSCFSIQSESEMAHVDPETAGDDYQPHRTINQPLATALGMLGGSMSTWQQC